jgi:hypothetical protein
MIYESSVRGLFLLIGLFPILMMEAYYFSKERDSLHSTRRYNPEDRSLLHVGSSRIMRTDHRRTRLKPVGAFLEFYVAMATKEITIKGI